MAEKKLKFNKKFIIVPIIVIITVAIAFICICFIGYEGCRLRYDVNSITAFEYENNPDCYRIQVKGTVKTWFFDDKTYESVTIGGPYIEGEPILYSAADSEPINISKEKTEFAMTYDIDMANGVYTFENDDTSTRKARVEEWFYEQCFVTSIDNPGYEKEYALYGRDYINIPFEWQESQTVTDNLLEE